VVPQENLLKEGLEIETDEGAYGLNFLKIHAPLEVLKRYAEILKIRMPIRVGQKDFFNLIFRPFSSTVDT
jgi:Dimerisation domain of Ca+-activated chloride-channel, anoctamin